MTTELTSERVEIDDDLWAANAAMERLGWTDGLPVIPPTEERVRRMLEPLGRQPQEEIGSIPPLWSPATLEKIAVNAVMAGCLPEYMPVLIAAVEAIGDPSLNLYALQATTGGPAILMIVNGPVRAELGLNSGANALGEGTRGNATLGRALRLIQRNIGGAYPGSSCKATLGWPGKLSFCIAENEEASPWEPLHVERGFPAGASTVTVISADSMSRVGEQGATTAEGVIGILRLGTFKLGSAEAVFVLGPDHAAMLARENFSKADVKKRLWEETVFCLKDLPQDAFEQRVKRRPDLKLTRESVFRLADRPEDILIVVAGGAGLHSVFVHVWGQSTPDGGSTRSVTRQIRVR